MTKYYYRLNLSDGCDATREASVFQLYYDRSNRDVFDNMMDQVRDVAPASLTAKDMQNASGVMELVDPRGLRYSCTKHINQALGLKNSQDTESKVPRGLVDGLVPWLKENRQRLIRIFDVQSSSSDSDFLNGVSLLNAILKKWSDSKLSAISVGKKAAVAYQLKCENAFVDMLRDDSYTFTYPPGAQTDIRDFFNPN